MSDALQPVARGRLYEQVIERLRAHVVSAGLSAGSRLPAADRTRRLGAPGGQPVVGGAGDRRARGAGPGRDPPRGGVHLRRDTLDVEPLGDLVARRRMLPDVLDARDALETKLAELTAGRRTPSDLATIDAAITSMRRQVDAGEPPVEGDRRFHRAVVAAAHSQLLAAFYDEIRDQIAQSRRESLRQPGRPAQSLADHARIAAAIRAGDGAAAAAAMHEHVDHVRRVRLLTWEPDG